MFGEALVLRWPHLIYDSILLKEIHKRQAKFAYGACENLRGAFLTHEDWFLFQQHLCDQFCEFVLGKRDANNCFAYNDYRCTNAAIWLAKRSKGYKSDNTILGDE